MTCELTQPMLSDAVEGTFLVALVLAVVAGVAVGWTFNDAVRARIAGVIGAIIAFALVAIAGIIIYGAAWEDYRRCMR